MVEEGKNNSERNSLSSLSLCAYLSCNILIASMATAKTPKNSRN